jgi:hypothetical protein
MPRSAQIYRDDNLDVQAAAATRRPGEFARNHQGAPWVADPVETAKYAGNKAQLIELCAKRGIEVPAKVTVAQLHELLGPRAKNVLYGRPSALGKQIENTTMLQKWSERAVALGLWLDWRETLQDNGELTDDPPLLADLAATDPQSLDDDEARDVLDAIAVKAKNRARAGIAAERGTHEHGVTEDIDEGVDPIERIQRGEELGIPAHVGHALAEAWRKMLVEFDLEILAVEATCVDDVWRQAGTLDRIARLRRDLRFVLPTGEIVIIPAGTVLILDIKTGKLRLDDAGFLSHWQSYAVQLASYAQSVPYDPDTDTRWTWEEVLAS